MYKLEDGKVLVKCQHPIVNADKKLAQSLCPICKDGYQEYKEPESPTKPPAKCSDSAWEEYKHQCKIHSPKLSHYNEALERLQEIDACLHYGKLEKYCLECNQNKKSLEELYKEQPEA